jgi:hypothetical protein
VLEGNFGSQQEAHARIDQIAACDRALDDTDTDS